MTSTDNTTASPASSTNPARRMSKDLEAALLAATAHDAGLHNRAELRLARYVDMIQTIDMPSLPQRAQARFALEAILTEMGPRILGGIVEFTLAAQTSLLGDCETVSHPGSLGHLGYEPCHLALPAHLVTHPERDAGPDTPAERARHRRLRSAALNYRSRTARAGTAA